MCYRFSGIIPGAHACRKRILYARMYDVRVSARGAGGDGGIGGGKEGFKNGAEPCLRDPRGAGGPEVQDFEFNQFDGDLSWPTDRS